MLESEPEPVQETSAENVSQDQPSPSESQSDENKPVESNETRADATTTEKPLESLGESVDQPNPTVESGEARSEAVTDETNPKDSEEIAVEADDDDTAVESEDSDFDVMEEIDPSYSIDSTLWLKVKDFDACDLKPAKKENPEGDVTESKEKKVKKEDEAAEEEDSGFSEIVIRSEKDRDQEFKEYIRELCRPSIVSYLPDRVAAKGTDIRLTCTVQGNNIQTKWMKNDATLERQARIQTRTDGEIHILEITKISEKDEGVYTAVFKNRAGEVETSSRIKVYDGKLHKPDHIDVALVKGESSR